MKFCLALVLLSAFVAAAPSEEPQRVSLGLLNDARAEDRSFLVNALVRQLFTFLRYIINNGSNILNFPPLDPLVIESYQLNVPAGIINLNLDLKNVRAVGLGGFIVKRSHLDLAALTFDVEIAFPKFDISAEEYDFTGDLYTAIPLFGKGKARFLVENFVFSAKLFLKQSDDRTSVLIDRIENARFEIPFLKSALTGVIGGGDIDSVVNAIIEDVIIDYVNRFQRAIASLTSAAVIKFGNPILNELDTWRYIAPLLPRPGTGNTL